MMSRRAIDDYRSARAIVKFWKRGTASHVETALLTAIAMSDLEIRARLRVAFPVLVQAWEDDFAETDRGEEPAHDDYPEDGEETPPREERER